MRYSRMVLLGCVRVLGSTTLAAAATTTTTILDFEATSTCYLCVLGSSSPYYLYKSPAVAAISIPHNASYARGAIFIPHDFETQSLRP